MLDDTSLLGRGEGLQRSPKALAYKGLDTNHRVDKAGYDQWAWLFVERDTFAEWMQTVEKPDSFQSSRKLFVLDKVQKSIYIVC
jgi:hypothetical protein